MEIFICLDYRRQRLAYARCVWKEIDRSIFSGLCNCFKGRCLIQDKYMDDNRGVLALVV